jgi:hypothetical protein
MEVHLPKPMHGWREFVGEVGIIVLGVLIALGAEQVVETFHQRAELRDAEDAMKSELRDDDLPQAFTRAAIFNCYVGQLDGIKAAVASGDRARFLTLARVYKPVYRTWDDEAWKAALASQVLVQAGSKRMIDWSTPYILIALAGQTAKQESDELLQLWADLSGDGPISAAQQDRLFQVISVLRGYNRQMTVSALIFIDLLDHRGLTLTLEQKRSLLAEARQKYGSCVREPSTARLNTNSQLSYLNGALGNE